LHQEKRLSKLNFFHGTMAFTANPKLLS